MAINLYPETLKNQLVKEIENLKKQAEESRTNQTLVLSYGPITLDGIAGNITVEDGSNNVIVTIDDDGIIISDTSGNDIIHITSTGMTVSDTSANPIVTITTAGITIKAISTALSRYFLFQTSAGANVAANFFRRYTSGSDEISDYGFRTYLSSQNQKVGYVTMDIFANDESTRTLFLQISETYNSSGVFTEATLNFAKHGATGSFIVKVLNTSGGGYLTIPSYASDPAGAGNGSLYYNTGTNKIKKLNGGSWTDVG